MDLFLYSSCLIDFGSACIECLLLLYGLSISHYPICMCQLLYFTERHLQCDCQGVSTAGFNQEPLLQ